MRRFRATFFVSALACASCGGNPDVSKVDGIIPPAGSSGTGNAPGSSGSGGSGGLGPIVVPGGGQGGDTPQSGGAGGRDRCAALSCGPGQRCDGSASSPMCVDNTCDDLHCSDTEECQPAPGGGKYCRSIACDSDVDCPEARHCDGSKCVDDSCEPDARTCDGNSVEICDSSGGTSAPAYSCHSAGYFESACSEHAGSGAGSIGCTCEGDWDCPEYTACEAGVCEGTGVAPTCTLPPTPFSEVLPKLEFRWGGTNQSKPNATGKAFEWAGQVASTPLVINLDDDNGDGLVNELDFPELLFMSYQGAPEKDGVVRAVHAGGPAKGGDYFALCGTTHWAEGEPVVQDCDPSDTDAKSASAALGRASGVLAAGDLDGDGLPEIVVPIETGAIQILDHKGQIITTSDSGLWPNASDSDDHWRYPAPAIANLDFDGLPEIVVGNRVLTLKKDDAGRLAVDKVFTGAKQAGTMHNSSDENHYGPSVCLADLVSAKGLEIVAGTSLYRLPEPTDCAAHPDDDYCTGKLSLVWNARDVNASSTFYPEGFCAVADVLGADTSADPGPQNPLDHVPEVLVIADGHLLILKGSDGTLLKDIDLKGAAQGGAPNVDDFDGDGYPEIATALSDFYTVVDLQTPEPTHCPAWPNVLKRGDVGEGSNPGRDPGGSCQSDADCNSGAVCNEKAGQCVCLHSGWKRDTEDNSSKVTSSSVFDFNGDGAAEVVYNDECYFHVYDGATGGVYLALPSLSRTIIENPVVADVDNDGNAEIVFVQNDETIQCEDNDDPSKNSNLNSWPDGDNDVALDTLPNGIEVWGDPSDVWVAARRIWNEHSYHVTNVTEGGTIPLHEPESFKPLNGRVYNTYRSQPRNYGVAPDLTPTAIQVSSPDVSCGELSDEIQISVLVKNAGDLRVGPGVEIDFSGTWAKPSLDAALEGEDGHPLAVILEKSLEPGSSTLVTVSYRAGKNGRDDLPSRIKAVVDAKQAERECHEDNNEIEGPVDAGDALADLRLEFEDASGCSPPEAKLTVHNDGATTAENVLIRVYAGDPSQGGQVIGEATLPDALEPGKSADVTVTLSELERDVKLYGVADPLNAVPECNDANNVAEGPQLMCMPIAR